MNITDLVRQNILALTPYTSARDEYTGNTATLLDANESPFETKVNRYPDPYQKAVKEKLSALKGITAEQLFLGNGSDEVIDLMIRVFCEPGEDNIVVPDPSYGMYEVGAAIQNISVKKVPLSTDFTLQAAELLRQVDMKTKLIFLCSPNNPSGNLFDPEEITKILTDFKGIVIIDEAYIDFTTSSSWIKKIEQYPNLLVLQTLSKSWGMAGIRLGMAFANRMIIQLLNKVKPPYNINVLTQEFVLKHIDEEKMQITANKLIAERMILAQTLEHVPAVLKVFPSEANFLLVKFQNHRAAFAALKENDLVVRDRSGALHCDSCLRITIGTPEENKRVINTLKQLVVS